MQFHMNGIVKFTFTEHLKRSTVMVLLEAIKHLNGTNVFKKGPTFVDDNPGRGGYGPTRAVPVNLLHSCVRLLCVIKIPV